MKSPLSLFSGPGLPTLALATLLASLGVSSSTVTLPILAEDFTAPLSQVQWVILAYLIAITILITVAGWLGDHYGKRPVLITGLALYAIAAGICAAAPWLSLLILARALQGMGGAILMALPMAMLRDMIPANGIGRAMGVMGTMSAIGTALGPALGGVLIEMAGWRAIFAVLAGAGFLGLAAIHFSPAGKPATRAKSPPVFLHMIHLKAGMGTGLLINLTVASVMMGTLVIGPFYLGHALGLTPALVGMVMSVGPVTSALSGVPAGRLTDRFGAYPMVRAGLAQMLVGLVCLAILPRVFGVAGYVMALILLTPGYQIFLAANNTAMTGAAPADQQGTVSGLLGLSRNLGLLAGTALFSTGFAALTGPQQTAAGMAFTIAFLSATGLIAIALFCARPADDAP